MASAHRYQWTRLDGTTGKGWRAKWAGVDGRQRTKRGFDRKGDAESYAHDREIEVKHGVKLDGDQPLGKVTVEAWAKTWQAGLDVRPQTAAAYGFCVKRINNDLGGRTLVSLRPSEMRAWRRSLTTRMAESTAQQTAAMLQMILRAAVQDGLLDRSPLPPAKGGASSSDRVLDPDELLTIAQVRAWGVGLMRPVGDDLADTVTCRMPIVAAATGLRQGELLGLVTDDVDFLGREIRVRRQLVTAPSGGGVPQFGPPKTKAGVRRIPLTDEALVALAQQVELYPSPAGEPIFLNHRGDRWRRQTFHTSWTKGKNAVKLPEWVHWHALRDVAASALIRSGADLRVVMNVMGHTSSEETLKTYARIWPDAQDVARKALNSVWLAAGDEVWSAPEGQGSTTEPPAAGQSL